MFFELQFSAAVFGRILRNRLRDQDLCRDQQVPNPDNFAEEMVLDQVIIGDNTTVQRELTLKYVNDQPQLTPSATQLVWFNSSTGNSYSRDLPYLQVKQEVSILLVRPADLDQNGVNPSPPRVMTIFPVFNVAAQYIYHGPITLSYQIAYIDYGAEPTTALERGLIGNFISGITLPSASIDLGPMSDLLHRPTVTVNAALACDPAGTRVALRADFEPMDRDVPAAVTPEFFLDGPEDLLQGREWAALMDANVLITQAVPPLHDVLHTMPKTKVLSDPAAAWEPDTATLRFVSKIRMLAACPGFVDDIDLDVELTLRAQFSLIADAHALRINHHLSRRFTDRSQVNGCAITGALLYPVFGAALLHKNQIGWSDYLAGIALGPIFTFGQLVAVINKQSLKEDISNDLGSTCRKLNDWEYECTTAPDLRMQFVPRQLSSLVIDNVRGVPQGLVLAGSIASFSDYNRGPINSIEHSGFNWGVNAHCNANRDGGGSYRSVNGAGLILDVSAPPTNLLPAHICSVRILNDPLDVFSILDIADDYLNVQAKPDPAYFANPYDCVVRLVTNRGVRNINFGIAHDATDQDRDKLQRDADEWRRFCEAITLTTLPFDELFKVPTGPAPPVEVFGVDHWILYRDLTISGLAPRTAIALRDNDSHAAQLHTEANDAGVAQLRSLTELRSPSAQTPLYLDFGTDTKLGGYSGQRQQILYAHKADITVPTAPRDLQVRTNETGQTHLSYAVNNTRYTWDISTAATPLSTRVTEDSRPLSTTPTPHVTARTENQHRLSENPAAIVVRGRPQATRSAPGVAAFGDNTLAEFVPDLGVVRIYESVKVGAMEDSPLPAPHTVCAE
jgi:hypothetical protein